MATGFSGKDAYLSFAGVDLSAKYTSFEPSTTQNTAETTGGSDDYTNVVATTKESTGSLEWVMPTYASGGSVLMTNIYAGAEGTIIFGPEGTAAGKPKYEGVVLITDVSEPVGFGDAVTYSVSWRLNASTGWISHPSNGSTF